jgi:hypothetical protein
MSANINLKKKWTKMRNNGPSRNLAEKLENGTYIIEKRLSGGGGGGAVYSLKNKTNNKHVNYVVKYMNMKNLSPVGKKRKFLEFARERKIGNLNRINEIAPRVLLSYVNRNDSLMFVMNELKMTRNNGVTGQTMASYLANKCPAPSTGFYIKFKEALEKLYKITGSWHGDMHLNNYYVFTNPDGKVVDIKFIDFGRSRKFNSTINFSTCGLNEILRIVHNSWASNPNNKFKYVHRKRLPARTPSPFSLSLSGTPGKTRMSKLKNKVRRCFGGKCMNVNSNMNVSAELAKMLAAAPPPRPLVLTAATAANKSPSSGLAVQRYNTLGPSNSNLRHLRGLNRYRNSSGVSAYEHLRNVTTGNSS